MIKDILGYSAAVCLVITLLPQIHLTWKTKQTDDISYGFLCLQLLTCFLFLSYGILLEELPLIIANGLVIFQSLLLFTFKCMFSSNSGNSGNSGC
jgi:MtN3 and saliva related transmembrane protein